MLQNNETKDLICIDSTASKRIEFVYLTIEYRHRPGVFLCIASKFYLHLIYWFVLNIG